MGYFFWAILAALLWGIVPLLEKLGLAKVSPFVGLFYRSIGVVIGLFILLIFMVKPSQIKTIDSKSAILLISGGFIASFLAQICFYNALKTGDISRAVPIAGSFPLIAFVLGILFLGESISLIKIIGIALIILGIWALKIG